MNKQELVQELLNILSDGDTTPCEFYVENSICEEDCQDEISNCGKTCMVRCIERATKLLRENDNRYNKG